MKYLPSKLALVALVALMIGCQSSANLKNYYSATDRTSVTPALGAVAERVELDQAWSKQTRMAFWFTTQGSRIIPYSWFKWLEQADKKEYFRSTDHMESLRYLPLKASSENPAGLPIGFARDQDKKTGQAWADRHREQSLFHQGYTLSIFELCTYLQQKRHTEYQAVSKGFDSEGF